MDMVEEDIFQDDLDILEIIDYGFPRRRHVRSEIFNDLDEYSFYKRFRLTKATTLNFFEFIENDLDYTSHMNDSVSQMNRLLIFLRFAGSGAHLNLIADFGEMDTSTVSRIIEHVSHVIALLRPQFVQMPSNQDQIQDTHNAFFEISHFPRVIGCIDGTHIRIQSPGGEDGEVFRNRKGYFSLNVQVIAGADLKILDIVSRWPGSQHDATIYNSSRIFTRFEDHEFPDCFLLGDSAYPLSNHLLTAFLNPVGRPERLYNEAQIRTRNTVERLFGVWKRRFPALAYGLRTKLTTTVAVIVAAAVVHNIAVMNNDGDPPPAADVNQDLLERLIEDGQIDVEPNFYQNHNLIIVGARNNLIQNYFARLPD